MHGHWNEWRFLARCKSVIFAHTTKNWSIVSVLDQFTKLIQANWFKNGFSVNTPTERWNKAIKLHACTYTMYKHTHKGMHTCLHTHTPPVVGACCVREAGLSIAPDSKVGFAATTEGTAVEWATQEGRRLWKMPLWCFSVKGKLISKSHSISRNTSQNTENNNSDVSVTYGCLH